MRMNAASGSCNETEREISKALEKEDMGYSSRESGKSPVKKDGSFKGEASIGMGPSWLGGGVWEKTTKT